MSSPPSSSESGFDRLHPGLQRWVWAQGWPSLRAIQDLAIPPILARTTDVVVSAPTAGGKTEAVFLPVLSHLASYEGAGVRCLCISPLRALINDQTRRVSAMAEAVDLRLQPWHGDVSAGRAAFWRRPTDLLMTTPESLESLLMSRSGQLQAAMPDLQYIVIDELHAFFGSERGAQLRSLLQRVKRLVDRDVPRIALSATLGDERIAGQFLRSDSARPAQVLRTTADAGEVLLQVRVITQAQTRDEAGAISEALLALGSSVDIFRDQLDRQPLLERSAPLPSPPAGTALDPEADAERPDRYALALDCVADHLFGKLRGKSHLVFANSRATVEELSDKLRCLAEKQALPNEFFPHHGSLSRDLRLSVEERLRNGGLPTTAVCTSTLEMGIDIGDVTSIAQVGPPPSVGSLKQRLGRSGRRPGESQTLRQYVILPALDGQSHPLDWLRLPLLQTIACIELMLEGRFEPQRPGDLHLSTLVQQVLSVICQNGGGAKAEALYRELCRDGAFHNVPPPLFIDVLRALGTSKVLEQTPDGTLLPGEIGEKLVAHYSFLASFQSPEEFTLLERGGARLGTLPITGPVTEGQYLIFAGRRWQVLEVSTEQRTLLLQRAAAGRPPRFGGGIGMIDASVHQKMRELLSSEDLPLYLDAAAQQALIDARSSWVAFGLNKGPAFRSANRMLIGHWAGSRVGTTLRLWLGELGYKVDGEGPFLELQQLAEGQQLDEIVSDALATVPEPIALARRIQNLREDKFHGWLSDEVLQQGAAARHLDIPAATSTLRSMQMESASCLQS